MFYIVKQAYIGPDSSLRSNPDVDILDIRKTPARKISDNEICINGWCGNSGDWSYTAYGEFKSLEAAREEILNQFGYTRVVTGEIDVRTAVRKSATVAAG